MGQASRKKQEKKSKVKRNLYGWFKHYFDLVLFIVVLIVVAVIIYQGCKWIEHPSGAVIDRFVLTGDHDFTSTDELRDVLSCITNKPSFVSVSVDAVQKEVMYLPWVKQVSVRKQWPDTLKIHLIEYKPIAQWNGNSYLDDSGYIFNLPANDRDQKRISGLVQLSGPDDSEQQVLSYYYELKKQFNLFSQELKKPLTITQLKMNSGYAWSVQINNETELLLGRTDLIGRLQRFKQIYYVLLTQQGDKIRKMDLRYSSGAAVTLS